MIVLSFVLLSRTCLAKSNHKPNELRIYYEVVVTGIVDGDTIKGDIYLGWNIVLKDQTIRLLGFDAWETSRRRRSVDVTDEEIKKGKIAEEELRELIRRCYEIYLVPGQEERGYYGRVLGKLYLKMPYKKRLLDVSKYMIQHGHDRWKSKQLRLKFKQ